MEALKILRQLALSFPETSEQPHFEKTSFRVGKKIFATYDAAQNQTCIKLSIADQDVFCLFDRNIIFPVANKWGQQGWTFINLQTISVELLSSALTTAYCEVAPKKLSNIIKTSLFQ